MKKVQYVIKGMNRDLSISKSSNEFSFENMNIRITARDDNTLLSITNEKGTKQISSIHTEGALLGYCVLNNFIVLFTKSIQDIIYKIHLEENGNYTKTELFRGDLGFNTDYPIESLGIYENEEIQKVYWTDNKNQPRVINIVEKNINKWNKYSFDFVNRLKLQETVKIAKNEVSNGIFSPGVIQYAFTYYNIYGQESNIFHTTPLYYLSYNNRGGSPEDKIGNSFNITIGNLDTNFDYVRVYSIHRSSENGTPEVKRIVDLKVTSGEIYYTDNGTIGDIEDPTLLLYIGGEPVVPKTLATKDNTLFLGNITLDRKLIPSEIRKSLANYNITFKQSKNASNTKYQAGYYPYDAVLNKSSRDIKSFKYLEWYRFGIQFQHYTGKWSEPLWMNDTQNTSSIRNTTSSLGVEILLPEAFATISDSNMISQLVSLGFIKARGVVVYPKLHERECICQGILCPTVFNVGDRVGNSPFSQSSWFVRPYTSDTVDGVSPRYNVNKGAVLECRHYNSLPSSMSRSAEIQSNYNISQHPFSSTISVADEFKSKYQDCYYIDQNIVTMHSPDIEFSEDVQNLDLSSVKLRIVGAVPIRAFKGSIDIKSSTTTGFINNEPSKPAIGAYIEEINSPIEDSGGHRSLCSGVFWMDTLIKNDTNAGEETGYLIYPWQRNGSLNNTSAAKDGYKSSLLEKKKISNFRYSSHTDFFSRNDKTQQTSNNVWYAENPNFPAYNTGISGVALFNSNEVSIARIPSPKNSGLEDINYYGNIDKVILGGVDRYGGFNGKGYPIMSVTSPPPPEKPTTEENNTPTVTATTLTYRELFRNNISTLTNDYIQTSTDPIRIKYKSTPHVVLALNYATSEASSKCRVLPTTYNYPNVNSEAQGYPFWGKQSPIGVSQDILGSTNFGSGFLWLGELYNDNVPNRFGGITEEAFENNTWLPSGEEVSLLKDNNPVSTLYIKWSEGDTYYQRHDCIKTFPYSLEDQNSVTDIVSFMCETRVNLDSRYDRNRGQTSNLSITPENFNKINKAYNQENNFFTYRSINPNRFNINNFPNTITWTKEKQLGALTDAWTNITMSSMLELDGDKGEVNSLNVFNNEIFCFQDKGFSNILFNSRVQIPTSDEVPIEITTGLKVQGKRYISNTIGCKNKWAIVESANGLYFMDDYSSSIFLYNGKLDAISDRLGFRQWVSKNNSLKNWDPINFNNFKASYDKINGDIYFANNNTCICYSELLGQFTSFMNYERVPAMFNIRDKFISVKDGYLWENNEGEYNMFYNEFKPFYVTYRVTPEGPDDKTFTNIEFKSDSYKLDNLVNETFDTLESWNEYQYGKLDLNMSKCKPSDLKKKFRIWRANIPRDKANMRDRMRNPWIYLKLSMNKINTFKTELHNLIVSYYD